MIDINGNGIISLAELDKGMRDIIRLPQLFKTKPVMLRAFNAAKNKVKSKSRHGKDYVEKKEFRYLMKYLRQYYEYWVAFDLIDYDSDKRISFEEFKDAIPHL
jgi:Ca2+-binding EF-hand superfamily protein